MRNYQVLSSLVIFAVGFALSAIVDSRRLASLAQGTQSNSPTPVIAEQNTRQPAALQQWEYRVVTMRDRLTKVDIENELKTLGEQGYEVCGVTQSQSLRDNREFNSSMEYNLTIVLRRPK